MTVLFGVGAVVAFLRFGYKTLTLLSQYRALSATESGSTSAVDGEEVTLEGTVVVEEPVDTDAVTEPDSPLALLVWRVQRLRGGNQYTVDLERRTLKRSGKTVDSGVESGDFSVDDGMREFRVDLSWLVETTSGSSLSNVSLSGLQVSGPRSNRGWSSPYVLHENHLTAARLDQRGGILGGESGSESESGSGINPRRVRLESRAVPDGESLAVHEEVAVDDGEPVIQGTEKTPMALSDQGLEGLGKSVRNQILKYGVIAVGALALALYLAFEIIGGLQ